jgi:hypothetical protein
VTGDARSFCLLWPQQPNASWRKADAQAGDSIALRPDFPNHGGTVAVAKREKERVSSTIPHKCYALTLRRFGVVVKLIPAILRARSQVKQPADNPQLTGLTQHCYGVLTGKC